MRDVRISVFQLFLLAIGMIVGAYGFQFFKEVPDWETAFIASFFQVWAILAVVVCDRIFNSRSEEHEEGFLEKDGIVQDAIAFVMDPDARTISEFKYPSGRPMSVREAKRNSLM